MKLLSLSNEITDGELVQLKFICKQHIPVGVLERIKRPLELFDELENRNLLTPDNKEFLAAILAGINRLELRDNLLGKGFIHLNLQGRLAMYHVTVALILRPCSHGSGGPQAGGVPCPGGVTNLSIQSLCFLNCVHMLGGVPHQGGLPGQPVRVTCLGGVSFL